MQEEKINKIINMLFLGLLKNRIFNFKLKKSSYVICFMTILSFFIGNGLIYAQKCIDRNLQEEIKKADLIFIGKITEISESGKPTTASEIPKEGQFKIITVVHPIKVYKGAVKEKILLKNENIGFNAIPPYLFYPFKVHESYLIFAKRIDSSFYSTGFCSPTKLLKKAEKDLKELEKYK